MGESMLHRYILGLSFSLYALNAVAAPHIIVNKGRNNDGFTRAQIINKSGRGLACYISIDGYKIKFHLPPAVTSKWYKATDLRFQHTDFSSWCGYIENHPEYKKYVY
jgi:hypothetical protein